MDDYALAAHGRFVTRGARPSAGPGDVGEGDGPPGVADQVGDQARAAELGAPDVRVIGGEGPKRIV